MHAVLEIMHHCVALPWDAETGFPPPAVGLARSPTVGVFAVVGEQRAGRKVHSCADVPPSSPSLRGPIEAVSWIGRELLAG